MAMTEYERAVKYARSGQAKQMAMPSRPSRLKEHLQRHHGVSEDQLQGEKWDMHNRAHAGVFGVAGTNEHRHHHEETDIGREQTVAMARMSQNFSDRRHTGQRGIYG